VLRRKFTSNNTVVGNKNQQIVGNNNKQVGGNLTEKRTIIINKERHHIVDSSVHITNNYYQVQGSDTIDMATNFFYEFVDSLTLIAYPKSGKWEKPLVIVRYSEKDCLAGLKSGQLNKLEGLIPGDSLTYSCTYDAPSATKFNPMVIALRCLPSEIVFGDAFDEKKIYILRRRI
jgi:hypothetical protein